MLPDIHRATQKFYIFLIVYLTGCTPYNIFFVHSTNKKEKESPEYYPFVEMSYIGADKIEFPMKKIRLLNGYNLEFNLCIELYADKMFINAEDIVIDGEKYELP